MPERQGDGDAGFGPERRQPAFAVDVFHLGMPLDGPGRERIRLRPSPAGTGGIYGLPDLAEGGAGDGIVIGPDRHVVLSHGLQGREE